MCQTEEANTAETLQRFNELEQRCSAMQSWFADASSPFTHLLQRHERLTKFVQRLQSNEEEDDRIQNTLDKMADVDGAIAEVIGDCRELLMKERPHVKCHQIKCLDHELGGTGEKAQKEFENVSVMADQAISTQPTGKLASSAGGIPTSFQRSSCHSPPPSPSAKAMNAKKNHKFCHYTSGVPTGSTGAARKARCPSEK